MVLNSGRGNRLLAVTDDAEGVAVMARTTPLLKGGVSQHLANRERSARVRPIIQKIRDLRIHVKIRKLIAYVTIP